jgi:hemoglobin-like flavoprotein
MQEHAKPICEALIYYLCTHEENKFLLSVIRDIAEQHVRFHIYTYYFFYYFFFDAILIFAPF